MEDFELPVTFRGQELLFPAHLQQLGYTYKVAVDVSGGQVLFEPDEEKNWRGVADPALLESRQQPDPELLGAMVDSLHTIFS